MEEDTFAVEDQYMIGEGNQYNKLQKRCQFINRNHLHVGGALLACPITDKGVQEVKILLPGSAEVNHPEGGAVLFPCHPSMSTGDSSFGSDLCFQVWYDISSGKAYKGGGTLRLPVNLLTVRTNQRQNKK